MKFGIVVELKMLYELLFVIHQRMATKIDKVGNQLRTARLGFEHPLLLELPDSRVLQWIHQVD